MRQNEITIGMTARVKIGSRLAPVTVERVIDRPGRRLQYQCLTHDTNRRITCTAARLRPATTAAREAEVVARVDARRAAAREPGATVGPDGRAW